jgi:DNA-binding transcriptional MerR regulator
MLRFGGTRLTSYRIRTVSEMSGVPTATLRAWERRYGIPAPARSASAYRLYDANDLAVINEMRDLVASGVAPREAAVALQGKVHRAGAIGVEARDPYAAAASRIVEATKRFDPAAIEVEIATALSLGPALLVFDRVLAPALHEVGELWHRGEVTIAQEHLVSHVVSMVTGQLLRLAQRSDGSRVATLACFADEQHLVPLLGVGLHFADWGFRTVLLGQRTPPAAIARTVETLKPSFVALSVTVAPPPPRARELCDAYADACRDVLLVVGGAGAAAMEGMLDKRGAIVVTTDIESRRRDIERAVRERAVKARATNKR